MSSRPRVRSVFAVSASSTLNLLQLRRGRAGIGEIELVDEMAFAVGARHRLRREEHLGNQRRHHRLGNRRLGGGRQRSGKERDQEQESHS
jgi:hypothetical protein